MSSDDKQDSFAAMFEAAEGAATRQPTRPRRVRVGDRLDAVVIQLGRDSVFVELDGKQQAFIETAELREEDGSVPYAIGDVIRAHVVEVDEERGVVRLGKSMGKPGSTAAIEQAKESGVAVEGKVTGVNKGGLEIELGGTRAFCPMSQVDAGFVEDPKNLIGQTLRFVVTEVKDGGKNVVLSRRALIERERGESAAKVLDKIVAGVVLRGTVTSTRDFGAFVDLGGVEGLIPRSEIAYDRSVAVADALKPGDAVEVQVREVKDGELDKRGRVQKKITLSLKALAADPWADTDVVLGRVYKGTVVRTTEFGRFVRLAPGIDALLHVSELSKSTKADDGEELLVVVKKLERDAKKIGVALAPDDAEPGTIVPPASGPEVRVGAVVTGTVERIETYGIFVQLEGSKGRAGRGLVPNAELGVPRGTDLRKTFPEGTKVTAKVLETGEGKLRLSIKGAKDAEERADFEAARGKGAAPRSLGTFADLLKGKKL
jgi:small subunit ribosomal protein S1